MIYAGILLGALIGGSLSGIFGAVAGGVLGYLLWSNFTLSTRLASLEKELPELRRGPVQSPRDTAAAADRPVAAVPAGGAEPPPEPGPVKDAELIRPPAGEDSDEAMPQWTPEWDIAAVPPTKPRGPEPSRANPVPQQILDAVNRFFTGGSMLVKTGVVVLFIGLSFLVKYAAEHALFPIELRLSAAALTGIVLLAVGWRLRLIRGGYAHVLQGGGVAVLYLTTFAAFRLYALIPPVFAFSILVAVAFVSSFLAVLQESRSLAVLGVSGGFLAPILASTGGGNHVVLFSYYALLNIGIAGIAWFRAWRILNLLGFLFTFVIGTAWGWRYYRPEYFSSTEPFLILFFILYTSIAILFALRQSPELKGYLDGAMVFGTPITAFALQARLVENYHFGLAWSATALGLFYIPLARVLFLKRPQFMRTLAEAFFAFGVLFGTLALPLALENRWTSAAWAVEGAGLIWAGTRQRRRLARAFGVLLQLGAGVFFLADLQAFTGSTPILNGRFLGCALIGLAGVFSSRFLTRQPDTVSGWERVTGQLLLAWGMIWWLSGGLAEIHRQVGEDLHMAFVLSFLAFTCICCSLLGKKLAWKEMDYPALALLPMLYISAVGLLAAGLHPFSQGGFAGWPVALAASYLILYRHEDFTPDPLHVAHAAAFWLVTGLTAWELSRSIDVWVSGSPVWPLSCAGLIPAMAVLLISTVGLRLAWPVARHRDDYLTIAAGPVALFAWLWIWYANAVSPGNPDPLTYLPILNPLDLAIVFTAVSLAVWGRKLTDGSSIIFTPAAKTARAYLSAATVFAWLNGVLVRTVHHWSGVPFSFSSLYGSVLLQTSLSIFWSLLALCAMIFATRKGLRPVWLTGASLLGMVVVKLFLIDLSGTGTVARIVSFVVVGILLLVVGYFSPVPPRGNQEAKP